MDTVEDFEKLPDHEYICKLINEYFAQKLLINLEEILNYRRKLQALPDSASEYSDEDEDYSYEKRQREKR
jgi:hypothetical protein